MIARLLRSPSLIMLGLSLLLLYTPLSWLGWCAFSLVDPVSGDRSASIQPFADFLTAIIGDSAFVEPILRSLLVAIIASFIATILGSLLAVYSESRASFAQQLQAKSLIGAKIRAMKWRSVVIGLCISPMFIPEIVLGIALLGWFSALGMTLGPVTLVIAHVTFSIGYVYAIVLARLQGMDRRLRDAAADLGASSLQIFFRVTLPIMLPGVVAGALMAFVLSFDDFLISYFVTGVGYDTLPIKLYAMMKFGLNPIIWPLSFSLVVLTAICVAIGLKVARRY